MSPWIIGGKEKLVQSSPVFRICSEIDLLFLSVTSFNLLAVRWSQWRHTANIIRPDTYQFERVTINQDQHSTQLEI